MDVRLISVPYDTARRGYRMGAGPDALLSAGLAHGLEAAGHAVVIKVLTVEEEPAPAEIATAFELSRSLAAEVRAARETRALPVVLTGNCISALGVVAGLGGRSTAVAWFDAHGDLNTPETTGSGFLDGMAIAIVLGRCWTTLAATVPGFHPVPVGRVVLLGVRDLDPAERDVIATSGPIWLTPDVLKGKDGESARDASLVAVVDGATQLYLHVDLDVLDPRAARANAFAVHGGLTVEDVVSTVARMAEEVPIGALTFSAYDPSVDTEARVPAAAARILSEVIGILDR